jgi:hypothetical protein
MSAHSVGRVFGIVLRVAGRQMVALAEAKPTAGPNQSSAAATTSHSALKAGRRAGRASRGIAKGIAGFIRPFKRIGGILWLEVAGVFFFVPVVAFTPNLLRTRPHSFHGPYDKSFLVTLLVMAVFFYLSVTSFWRAGRK